MICHNKGQPLTWDRKLQNVERLTMFVGPKPLLTWDSGVKAQHKNKLWNSVEIGLTRQIDTKHRKQLTKTLKKSYQKSQNLSVPTDGIKG